MAARHTIIGVLPKLEDDAVMAALVRAAQELARNKKGKGGAKSVRLLFAEPAHSTSPRGAQQLQAAAQKLAKEKEILCKVAAAPVAHHFLVVDNVKVFSGSFGWTAARAKTAY